jgi:uncharacterized membrane protein
MLDTLRINTTETDAPRSTAKHPDADVPSGLHLIARTVTVNRPREELYRFWRQPENLAKFMGNIRQVRAQGPLHSRWTLAAPGDKDRNEAIEWDSVIVEDVPNEVIAWRSADGEKVGQEGRVQFRDAAPGRGTEVTATILYRRHGGPVGALMAKLFHNDPKVQTRRELRRFKQLMESGEVSTAQPSHAAPRA